MDNNRVGLIDVNNRVREEFEISEGFNHPASTTEIFNTTQVPYIRAAIEGVNVSVFLYGASGSGKEHTMIGNSNADAGLIDLISDNVFNIL